MNYLVIIEQNLYGQNISKSYCFDTEEAANDFVEKSLAYYKKQKVKYKISLKKIEKIETVLAQYSN